MRLVVNNDRPESIADIVRKSRKKLSSNLSVVPEIDEEDRAKEIYRRLKTFYHKKYTTKPVEFPDRDIKPESKAASIQTHYSREVESLLEEWRVPFDNPHISFFNILKPEKGKYTLTFQLKTPLGNFDLYSISNIPSDVAFLINEEYLDKSTHRK